MKKVFKNITNSFYYFFEKLGVFCNRNKVLFMVKYWSFVVCICGFPQKKERYGIIDERKKVCLL